MLNQKKKYSPYTIACGILLGVVIVALLLFAAFNAWVNRNCFVVEVSGESMLNTIQDKDLLYVREIKAERGDVVIISVKNYRIQNGGSLYFSGDYIIKRLIAVEGDTVKCEDGVVSVKYAGQEEYTLLDEPYAKGSTPDFVFGETASVGSGEIFFLGDNRQNSYDSTEIGCLKEEDIVGVVPEWAIKIKSFSTFWENMRTSVAVHQ